MVLLSPSPSLTSVTLPFRYGRAAGCASARGECGRYPQGHHLGDFRRQRQVHQLQWRRGSVVNVAGGNWGVQYCQQYACCISPPTGENARDVATVGDDSAPAGPCVEGADERLYGGATCAQPPRFGHSASDSSSFHEFYRSVCSFHFDCMLLQRQIPHRLLHNNYYAFSYCHLAERAESDLSALTSIPWHCEVYRLVALASIRAAMMYKAAKVCCSPSHAYATFGRHGTGASFDNTLSASSEKIAHRDTKYKTHTRPLTDSAMVMDRVYVQSASIFSIHTVDRWRRRQCYCLGRRPG